MIIAESSGVSLRERDGRLLIVDHGIGWVPTVAFVSGLLAFLMLVNGLVQIGMVAAGREGILVLGLILTTVGVGAGLVLRSVVGIPRKRRATAAEELRVIAMIDLGQQVLMDPRGTVLTPLSLLRLERAFQIGSSARSLVARWPQGKLLLARGNPFAGGVDALESALVARLPRVS